MDRKSDGVLGILGKILLYTALIIIGLYLIKVLAAGAIFLWLLGLIF